MHTLRVPTMVAAFAFTAIGCTTQHTEKTANPPATSAAATAPNVVVVKTRDYGFDAPDTVRAGLTTLRLVTNPEHLKKLEAVAPRHWGQKNLQVVIATDVIHASSGPPTVLAAYFW